MPKYTAPMILVYNFLSLSLILLLLPVTVPVLLLNKKYRGRSLERLGLRAGAFRSILVRQRNATPVIWVHALSVGEVTSALPLVRGIRESLPSSCIVFTASTRSGRTVADTLVGPYVDLLLNSPFDLWFSVQRYLAVIKPDLFVLVETDFWPNWLYLLNKHTTPTLLVNGRISERSFAAYKRFRLFWAPVFNSFARLSMQTAGDRSRMIDLGLARRDKVITLGNLKYDMEIGNKGEQQGIDRAALAIDAEKQIWVCGSTHPGEEEILFAAFQQLLDQNRDLFFILAPRDIGRSRELVNLAGQYRLNARTRSSKQAGGNVLILDTIGELATCYSLAWLAFVGGSLVAQGGHNPIEPAAYGVPVLFGNHMEDFAETAHDLTSCGGAKRVTEQTLAATAQSILDDEHTHDVMSAAATALVQHHRGVVANHLQVIGQLLAK